MDAGTGLINLGRQLIRYAGGKKIRIHLLFTHFHLDHLIGLPFFRPLHTEGVHVFLYSALRPEHLQRTLNALMGGRYFPVRFEKTPAEKILEKIPNGIFSIGGVQISTCPLRHPQGSLAYKFQIKDRSVILATDTEHPESGMDETLAAFAQDADCFIYDAMYTPDEYRAGRKGWGHSTWLAGVNIAIKAGVKNLYLSHHNPEHSDAKIDQILVQARKTFPRTFGAREGRKI